MSAVSLEELAARTPDTRDRSVDFLRAFAILAVVFGHWFIGIIHWDGGIIRTTSAVGETSYLWLMTWFFQVMPIFFFVGGFSNYVAYQAYRQRGESTGAFIRSRLDRLLRPSLVFFAVWTVAQIGLHIADIGTPSGPHVWGDTQLLRGMKPPGATVPFGPLWFLAVYLVVVALAPLTIRLHERFRWWVPAAMVVGTVVADAIGFMGGVHSVRWFNVIFVLLFPHQLGHFLGDGSLAKLPRRVFWAMVFVGLAGLVVMTNPPLWKLFGHVRYEWFPGIGTYPKSLLGTDVERVSNAFPPTICFLLAGASSIGAAMLVRPALQRWLQRPRPWTFTIAVNGVIMTLFLWHMTAYLLAILLLWPLGFGQQQDSTARWWWERFVWLGVPAVILLGLVAIFGRFERPRPRATVTTET